MKKKTLLLVFVLFLMGTWQPLTAQNDCGSATAQIDLNANNVRARLRTGGDFWWDGSDGKYIVPTPPTGLPETSSLFAGGLWMGGLDENGDLHLAAQTYGSSFGSNDYFSGPLDPETGETMADICQNWDRFFVVTKDAVAQHIADAADGSIDNPLDMVIGWPGNGNAEFSGVYGFELPPPTSQGLAPFIDLNGDGIYQPMQGEYPEIKGDQNIWWVFNDAGNIHNSSNGAPLHFEIQVMAYASASEEPAIDNTTCYDFRVINRHPTHTISDLYMGLWVDFALGCYTDDYFGIDSAYQMAYIYNEDALDGDVGLSCPGGVNTYGMEIPMLGIKYMGDSDGLGLTNGINYLNGGLGLPPPGQVDPSTPTEYYNYLRGIWSDGSPLCYGGDGYGETPCIPTNYLFQGAPDNPDEWSMCTEAFPQDDRRIVISSGPAALAPGEIRSFSYALITVLNVPHPCPSLTPLQEAADVIDEMVHTPIFTAIDDINTISNISLAPNPTNGATRLSLTSQDTDIQSITLIDLTGKIIQQWQNIHQKELEIARNHAPDGLYFLKIKMTNGKEEIKKLIWQ